MAIFRRNKIWWTDFAANGQRFRQSLKTTDWRKAQSAEKQLIAQAERGKLSAKTQHLSRLKFSEASERYVNDRKPNLAPRSFETEMERRKPLCAYFGHIPVVRISPDSVRAYIADRNQQGVSNKTVNLELGVLRGVLKRAKRWHLFSDEIKPLPVRHRVGRALTAEEKQTLKQVAAEKPEWQNARLAKTLALNTTMRSCELKGLRWRDVDFMERTINIWQSKTDAGYRLIPLNTEAWNAILELYHRSRALGGSEPAHFVFPACGNGKVDPSNPQKSWRSAWRSLTRAIKCNECGKLQGPGKACRNKDCRADLGSMQSPLAGLRFHDLRHHAITELAESSASDSTIMAIAGHVSREMLEHYSHIRLEAKRRAVEALSGQGSEEGYVTKHVTMGTTGGMSRLLTVRKNWSGREDLNLRPPGPEPGALPG
jgi:integrase